jgi:hypothetical protein
MNQPFENLCGHLAIGGQMRIAHTILVLFSNLGRDTVYYDRTFSWFPSVPPENSGILPRLGHDHFLSYLFPTQLLLVLLPVNAIWSRQWLHRKINDQGKNLDLNMRILTLALRKCGVRLWTRFMCWLLLDLWTLPNVGYSKLKLPFRCWICIHLHVRVIYWD